MNGSLSNVRIANNVHIPLKCELNVTDGAIFTKSFSRYLCEVNKKKIEDVDDKKAKTSLRKLSLFEFRDFFSEKLVESKCRCLAATPSIVLGQEGTKKSR